MQVLEDMHAGKLKPEDLNMDLFLHYKNTMTKGAGKGFKQDFEKVDYDTPDYALLAKMKANLYGFAGAKTHAHLKELNSLLYGADGKLIPLKDFKDKASAFYKSIGVTESKYKNWLNIEYDTAIAQGTIASQWVGWMDNIDIFPNLRYHTAGDDHVRHEHAKLDGVVVAKNSAYCDAIIPVKDYGCRCGMTETTDPLTDKPPAFQNNTPFTGNVGKHGMVINKNHPYYPTAKNEKEQLLDNVNKLATQEFIEKQKSIYDLYNGDSNYSQQYFDTNTGGYIVRHAKADSYNIDELKAINTLAKLGEGIILPATSNAAYTKEFDILLNHVPFEIKTISGDVKKQVEKRVKEAMTQAGNVVLQFSSKPNISELKRGLGNVKNSSRLNAVIILVNDIKTVITKKEILAGEFEALKLLK